MDEQDLQDITEGGFSNPPIRRGEACLAHLAFTPPTPHHSALTADL